MLHITGYTGFIRNLTLIELSGKMTTDDICDELEQSIIDDHLSRIRTYALSIIENSPDLASTHAAQVILDEVAQLLPECVWELE